MTKDDMDLAITAIMLEFGYSMHGHRLSYLAGMRAAADITCDRQYQYVSASDIIRAAADELERS